MERIVITGGSGLAGANIAKTLVSKFEVYGLYNTNKVEMKGVDFRQVDLSRENELEVVSELGPSVIIHCAAFANLDGCEQDPDRAYRDNVVASINIAQTAKKVGAYLIHISTDSVFDGERGVYRESDGVNPINVYGRTKLQAEREVQRICPDCAVVRTNFYGWNKREKLSMAEWMLDKLEKGQKLTGFKDVYFSPLLVNDLAEALAELYERRYAGVIHIAGGQTCSKLEFAYLTAKVFGFKENLIEPISVEDLNLPAPRGKNISLNVSKAQNLLRTRLGGAEEGLKKMKYLRESEYVEELKG
jgi:dTDP-4-dehydrorhamnose reductase